MTLNQLNVGNQGFMVTSADDTWSDFLGDDYSRCQGVVTYIDTCVRLQFDPPQSGYYTNVLIETKKELEFRLNVLTDPPLQTN